MPPWARQSLRAREELPELSSWSTGQGLETMPGMGRVAKQATPQHTCTDFRLHKDSHLLLQQYVSSERGGKVVEEGKDLSRCREQEKRGGEVSGSKVVKTMKHKSQDFIPVPSTHKLSHLEPSHLTSLCLK